MTVSSLPAIPTVATVQSRLERIFPDTGVDHRGYCVRESAAKTIVVAFYTGAIEGSERWIRPSQVTNMTDAQLALDSQEQREAWTRKMLSNAKKEHPVGAWYATNTREQIRDEDLRQGLIPKGAFIEKANVPTTSSAPKYALARKFAELFDAALTDNDLDDKIEQWQKTHLSKAALARLVLAKKSATSAAATGRVLVTLPNKHTLSLAPGQSSVIAQAVIEKFAPKFLDEPALLWVSESATKVVDASLAETLGFRIDPSKHLPDLILADVGADETLIVFVEVVHTDGPVDDLRKEALKELAIDAGFSAQHLAYVTAFTDRSAAPYKKLASELAWGTFVWFASEPDCVIRLEQGSTKKLRGLR